MHEGKGVRMEYGGMSLRSYERENGLRLQITPMVVSYDLPAACCACPYAISAS